MSVLDFAINAEPAVDPFTLVVDEDDSFDSEPTWSDDDSQTAIDQGAPQATEIDENLIASALGEDWAEYVSGEDARFADILPTGYGTFLSRIELLTSPTATELDLRYLAALSRLIPKLRYRTMRIANMPLDLALREFVAAQTKTDGEKLEAILARIGWGMEPPATLQTSAEMIGVTRERMRQVQAKVNAAFPNHAVYMPSLDRALNSLALVAPISAARASKLLVSAGISTIPIRPINVLAAADLCGRSHTFKLSEIGGEEWVVTEQSLAYSNLIRREATRLAITYGACKISELSQILSGHGVALSTGEVTRVLVELSGSSQLLDNWVCINDVPESRNPIHLVCRAILSVAPSVPIEVMPCFSSIRTELASKS